MTARHTLLDRLRRALRGRGDPLAGTDWADQPADPPVEIDDLTVVEVATPHGTQTSFFDGETWVTTTRDAVVDLAEER